MLALSHTTGYAIQALCCIENASGQHVGARQIATCTGIPKPYLSKLLHALGKSGLITTKRGYQGGFLLPRSADRIRLLEVVEAVEGRRWQPRCLLGMADCSDERDCPTHAFWKVERERIQVELNRLTLAKIAAFERANERVHVCCGTSKPRRVGNRRNASVKANSKGNRKGCPGVRRLR